MLLFFPGVRMAQSSSFYHVNLSAASVTWSPRYPESILSTPVVPATKPSSGAPPRDQASVPSASAYANAQSRVFFDSNHQELLLVRSSTGRGPPPKLFVSERAASIWHEFPLGLPPCDIAGACWSPDKQLFACLIQDKEVKVTDAKSGEVVTARSCRGSK